MTELPISEARDSLDDLVANVEHTQERVILTRHGRPVAAVVTMGDFRALEAAEDEAALAAVHESLASEERRVPHSEILSELGLT